MRIEKIINDLETRAKQLEMHLIQSNDYLEQANRQLKRQAALLYLAISLLLIFLLLHQVDLASQITLIALSSLTSLLAIVNCCLLIRTRSWFSQLNARWLQPHEKRALEALRQEHAELLHRSRSEHHAHAHAPLN